jgi:hypothetical protein
MMGFGVMTGECGGSKARRKLWVYRGAHDGKASGGHHQITRGSSLRGRAQVALILGTAERETPEITISEEEDRLLGCPT